MSVSIFFWYIFSIHGVGQPAFSQGAQLFMLHKYAKTIFIFILQEKLLRPQESRSSNRNVDNTDNSDMGPKVADWRFGPAQVWYDMLDVPETGEGFNYGFKLREKVCSHELYHRHI